MEVYLSHIKSKGRYLLMLISVSVYPSASVGPVMVMRWPAQLLLS